MHFNPLKRICMAGWHYKISRLHISGLKIGNLNNFITLFPFLATILYYHLFLWLTWSCDRIMQRAYYERVPETKCWGITCDELVSLQGELVCFILRNSATYSASFTVRRSGTRSIELEKKKSIVTLLLLSKKCQVSTRHFVPHSGSLCKRHIVFLLWTIRDLSAVVWGSR